MEGRYLGERKGRELLTKYNILLPPGSIARNREEAVRIANTVGYPVVMKAISRHIVHKSDADVVKVEINTDEECRQAFMEILRNADRYFKERGIEGRVEGIMIEREIKGFEFIVGGKEDELFGKTIMFGTGGVYAELIKDISFRLVPITREDIESMFSELKSQKVINEGFRNIKINKKALIKTLLQVAKLIEKEDIREMDINPLICNEQGCFAADVRFLM